MSARLYAFGGLRLEAHGSNATGGPAQRRRLALLALLASFGTRGLSRDKAIGYLWPDHTEKRARHLLSESIYVVRQFIGDDAIVTTPDDVSLGAALWCDAAAFRAALAANDLESAVNLYAGPFLDGFFVN